MDHDAGVGEGLALALGTRAEQEGAHGSCGAKAHGGDVAGDVLHGVIDGHAGRDGAAGGVDCWLRGVRVRARWVREKGGANDGQFHHREGRGGAICGWGAEKLLVEGLGLTEACWDPLHRTTRGGCHMPRAKPVSNRAPGAAWGHAIFLLQLTVEGDVLAGILVGEEEHLGDEVVGDLREEPSTGGKARGGIAEACACVCGSR